MKTIGIGEKLPNGATLLAIRFSAGTVVLADTGETSVHRYVTWRTDEEFNCYWGD